MDNQRNLILAVVLSGLLILGWDLGMRFLYPEASVTASVTGTGEEEAPATATASGAPVDLGADVAPHGPLELGAALGTADRVRIDAPRVRGSINLIGARIDDVVLNDYNQTVDKTSGNVQLFAPARTGDQYFAEFGFIVEGKRLPSSTKWVADGDILSPETPVTLTHSAENGITYSITYTIDDQFMINAVQKVENTGEGAAIVQPFALLDRSITNASPDEWLVHAGPIGSFDGTIDEDYGYDDLPTDARNPYRPEGAVDWIGFTDRYWLSALIPETGAAEPAFRRLSNGLYRADISYAPVTVAAGDTLTQSTKLFAGAKESAVLDAYAETDGIAQFDLAISWGWFWFLEKPMLWLLKTIFGLIGNFGVAIIALTFVIRGLLFPIAQKQFASMAQMKAVQPKMKQIQERFKDDKQQQQQEIMKLYKDEGVNPLAGCLPLLIQIPIFFALYKVLILAIEMRHEEFIPFWIKDLSAPDPWTILNLFGLLPFEVPGFLGIGVLAVLLGVTMWLTFKLNPSTMDPMQQQIFNIMPWVLMFVMAPFAAGLLLYWVTSNVLTLAQQTYLYSRHPQLKAAAEKEKAEKAKEKAAEADSKA
ncbi:membrane protein insertase YidC [Erythrobacter sp. YT30]|uniref:membrane protein insertase YidC n=1 Tax=Erythrobacter sp. YT30 TaxID=1735012 RepID=UPI00076C61CB|nr:membrane protein insertase YidC [Erythrobacter sp. YT30]KWV91134.1 preprotein translocase YidC [Erythrobacter sp. YT30]